MSIKTAAIICEFNPFHTGHAYLIRTIREKLGFDRVVCFMSGNFVQRGEPAIMDKYLRAGDALKSGADLVLELPVPFSASAAGWFAHAAVSMILKSGICTHLIFGLEPGFSLEGLEKEASLPIDPAALKDKLRQGRRYADALFELRHPGCESFCSAALQPFGTPRDHTPYRGSNALLALAYLEALKDLDLPGSITPLAVTRQGDAFGADHPNDPGFTSASALRRAIREQRSIAETYLPFPHPDAAVCFPDAMSMLLNEKLLSCDDYTVFWDVPLSLSEHLRKTKYEALTFSGRVEDCLHSCYSRSRISRALLHILLGITAPRAAELKDKGYVSTTRALAYRSESGLLREVREHGDLTVYTKNARFYEAEPDLLYSDQIWHILTNTPSDFLQPPVIL